MSCLSVKRENMAMIESACNNYATLCRKLIEVAELANVYKEGPRTRSGHYCAYETAITKILETLNDK